MVTDRIWRALVRRPAQHRRQTLPAVLGITLGVAVVVAVDLANQSVRRSFELSMQQITGRATHRIIGGPQGVDERFYAALRLEHGLRNAAPVVEGAVQLGGETFRLLGFDPLAEAPFRPWMSRIWAGDSPADQSGRMRALMTRPDTVLMAAAGARRLGLSPGDTPPIRAAGIAKTIRLAGVLDNAPDGLLFADLAVAQEVLGQTGRLDRIDLILDDSEAARAAALLPAGLRLVAPENRNRAAANLGKSFQTNLAAMSLLALLVGGFLIYNAMSFSVLRRRELLGLLRMLGVTRAQLFARILLEAAALGLAGTLLGLLAGAWLGQALVVLVARTVNELYFTAHITGLLLAPSTLFKGSLLGLLVTLVAACLPALEAARTQPQAAARRSVAEQRARDALPGLALAGAGAMLCGAALLYLPGDALLPGFAGLFGLIIGFCLCTPLLALGLTKLLAPPARAGGFTAGLALRAVGAGISRTGPAIAALTMAVAATIGMGIMVESFRGAVADWLTQSLPGDLYLSIPPSVSRRAATPLPDALFGELRGMQGVAALSSGRRVEVESDAGPVELFAVGLAPGSYAGFHFKGAPLPDVWDGFHRGELVLISEPYGFHRKLAAGDSLGLLTASGERRFTVGGVFRDYGSERGVLVMARRSYARLWRDDRISSIGVYFDDPGHGSGAGANNPAAQRVRALAAQHDPRIRVRSNREILDYSLRVFDRTFTITRVLRLLVILAAFVGILSALMALQFERARENAVLRAAGFTRFDLLKLTTVQTGIMGLSAGLLALPLGWLIAQMLIHVINPRSFGWTLASLPAPMVYVQAMGLAVGAALLAGIYPGLRMSRASPAEALREE